MNKFIILSLLLFMLAACMPPDPKYGKMIQVTPGEDVTFNLQEDTAFSFGFVALHVDDQMVDPQIHIISEPKHGKLSNCKGDKNILRCTYTPDKDYNGEDSFKVVSNDGDFQVSSPTTVTFMVEAVADAPVVDNSKEQNFTVYSNEVLNFEVNPATDVDTAAEDLRYLVVQEPALGKLKECFQGLGVRSCIYTPTVDRGVDTLTYKVVDKEGAASQEVKVTITIKKYYPPPVVGADQTLVVDFQSSIQFEVSQGSDLDSPIEELKYVVATAPEKGTLTCFPTHNSRACEYTPSINGGSDVFSYKIIDPDGMESKNTATVTIKIKKQLFNPVAFEGQSLTATYNSTLNFEVPQASYPYPPDAFFLKYQVVQMPTKGKLSNCFNKQSYNDRSCDYTPVANGGSDSFTYKVVDADMMESKIVTVNIKINAIANPPVGGGAQNFEVTYGSSFTFTVSAGDFTYPSDAPKKFNYRLNSSSLGEVSNCFVAAGGRECTYKPTSNGGQGTITYTVIDPATNLVSDQITVTINIRPVDFVPTASDMKLTVAYGSSNIFDVSEGKLETKRYDNPYPTFSYKLHTGPTKGTLTDCFINSNRRCTYTSTTNGGEDTLKYTIIDNFSKKESLPITVNFNISLLHPPVAASGQEVVVEYNKNPPFEIIAATDLDSTQDKLTYTVIKYPEYGNLYCFARECTYTPTITSGSDSFQYTVSDGLLNSNPSTVNIKILAAPTIAKNDPITLYYGDSVGLLIGNYNYPGLSNISLNAGLDSNPLHVLRYKIVKQPQFGSLSCMDVMGLACLYTSTTPTLGDSFSYAAYDTLGNESLPTTVFINLLHRPHVGNNQIINVLHQKTQNFNVNAGSDYDDAQESLSYVIEKNVTEGTLTCFTGATPLACSYTTNANISATEDSFTYKIIDSKGNVSNMTAKVTFKIAYPPRVGADQEVVAEYKNSPSFLVNKGFDMETAEASLSYKVKRPPTNGTLSSCFQGMANRSCLYTPNTTMKAGGEDSFEYVVVDGHNNESLVPAIVTIKILPPPAVGSNQSISVTFGQAKSFSVSLANDSIPEHRSGLNYILVENVQHGNLSCFSPATSRECKYTPSVKGGSDFFTYKVKDVLGNESQTLATVSITIEQFIYAPTTKETPPISVKINTPASFMVSQASDGDTIAENLKYVVVSNPKRGALKNCFVNGAITKGIRSCEYHPNLGEVGGEDSFTYKVVDDTDLESAVETVIFKLDNYYSKSETFTITEDSVLNGVDILWVIDNSSSMGNEQQALANNFDAFINDFTKSVTYKFNMYFITSDTDNYKGQFLKVASDVNYQFNHTTLGQNKTTFINNFKNIVNVGTRGSSMEQPFKSIQSAYVNNPSISWNDSSRALVFIIFSDENEQSASTVDYWVSDFQSVKSGRPSLLKMFAVINPSKDLASKYQETVAKIGGLYLNINDLIKTTDTAQTLLTNLSASITKILDSFSLNCPGTLVRESVHVRVNGVETSGWTLSGDGKSLTLTPVPAKGSTVVISYNYF
ncbi:MAG: tandem-95 repeat protein [Oligoflexia bacterium]|nr:tandem-95 repeat protein [Oligoflexia bacterium]